MIEAFLREAFEKRRSSIKRKLKEYDEKEKLLLLQFGKRPT
jgi:hypothetical protein